MKYKIDLFTPYSNGDMSTVQWNNLWILWTSLNRPCLVTRSMLHLFFCVNASMALLGLFGWDIVILLIICLKLSINPLPYLGLGLSSDDDVGVTSISSSLHHYTHLQLYPHPCSTSSPFLQPHHSIPQNRYLLSRDPAPQIVPWLSEHYDQSQLHPSSPISLTNRGE